MIKLNEDDYFRLQELTEEMDEIRERNGLTEIELKSTFRKFPNKIYYDLTMVFRGEKERGEDFKMLWLNDHDGRIVKRTYQEFLEKR